MFALLLLSFFVSAQRPADVVKWLASAHAEPVVAGGELRVALTAKIQNGWKLYALIQPKGGPLPLAIVAGRGSSFTVEARKIAAPLPKVLADENFNLETMYYEGEAVFTVPVTVAKTTAVYNPFFSIAICPAW